MAMAVRDSATTFDLKGSGIAFNALRVSIPVSAVPSTPGVPVNTDTGG
jgi:hypothetical protein